MKNFYDAIVIGSGAAGFSAAIKIAQSGKKPVIVTENINFGTSRNTGSDKQTYYKLGLGGDSPDSIRKMAQNLFSCGAVDGDNALCEAALSARCFYNLCEMGVGFPHNRYGEYVGYKTDHDPYARATSAGPLTSKYMTEALEKKAKELKIDILDNLLCVEILKNDKEAVGITCLDKTDFDFIAIFSPNVVLATGGPAGIYLDSVYPECHTGSTGLAVEAGVSLQNMTEWQYGLASINPRWNVSGTYMQVLPRFVSIDSHGNEHEFLEDAKKDLYELLSLVFLKGYQWPFDSKKVPFGSSYIDILVHIERNIKNRRVFLDYTKNPFSLENIDFSKLSNGAFEYLDKANATFGKPIDRLIKMNEPAFNLFKSKGVDLSKQMLEISLCAQHNNGGISVDLWWQTELKGLFAVGECAGTHGITRPGGSALNAGQVGALRAGQYISSQNDCKNDEIFESVANKSIKKHRDFCKTILSDSNNVLEKTDFYRQQMSKAASAIRNPEKIKDLYGKISNELDCFEENIKISNKKDILSVYKLKDLLTVQKVTLFSMSDYIKTVKTPRGSAIISNTDKPTNFETSEYIYADKIQEIKNVNGKMTVFWRNVRPLPEDNDFFENVWNGYRTNKNIY